MWKLVFTGGISQDPNAKILNAYNSLKQSR